MKTREWDESKHPRDELGRFTEVSGKDAPKDQPSPRTYRQNTPYGVIISLQTFGGKKKKEASTNEQLPKEPPKRAFGFNILNTKHHIRHAKEMGFNNQRDYERAAIDFWENGEGDIYYGVVRKCFYKINRDKTMLLSVSDDGIIHTFYTSVQKKIIKTMIKERMIVWRK